MVRLDDACRELGVPLILARSYGLVGSLRASLPEHCVVESKPDNSVEDLRLHRPWPELAAFARSFDLAAADDVTHRHIPWGAGTYPGVRAWRLRPGSQAACCCRMGGGRRDAPARTLGCGHRAAYCLIQRLLYETGGCAMQALWLHSVPLMLERLQD